MKIHGWCTECRKIRRVTVTRPPLPGQTAQGVCDACEEEHNAPPARRRV